jgi:uncharacterized membrane protein YgdD (TMEM256/DUF423 family)
MHKGFLRTAIILGAISVAMGAFGAHSLKGIVSERVIATFDTAVRYQFIHVFALLFTGILYKEYAGRWLVLAGWSFIAGLFLFCGSLYVLAYSQATVQPGFSWVGPITPFGGLAFILGWLFLLVGTFKKP